MKIKSLFILLLFCCSVSIVHAQQSAKDEYIIDASQRPGPVARGSGPAAILSYDEQKTLVLLNGKSYKGELLSKLLPYFQDDKQVKSIKVDKEESVPAEYRQRYGISQLVRVKLSRKLARQIRKQHPSLAVN